MVRIARKSVDVMPLTIGDKTYDFKLLIDRTKPDEPYFIAEYGSSPLAAVRVTDTDLVSLRKKAHDEVIRRLNLSWEPFLYITVKDGRTSEDGEDEFSLETNFYFVMVGTAPDGTKYHTSGSLKLEEGKPWDGTYKQPERLSGSLSSGLPSTGITMSREYSWRASRQTGMQSLVPATPETVEAMRSFNRNLRKLKEQMFERFNPDNAEATIAMLGKGGLLLPGGKT